MTTYELLTAAVPKGIAFESMRWGVDLVRGSTVTTSPDVLRIEFEWQLRLPAKWGWQLDLIGDATFHHLSPGEQWDRLIASLERVDQLLPFTFRDNEAAQTYYVAPAQMSDTSLSGHDKRWTSRVMVLEP